MMSMFDKLMHVVMNDDVMYVAVLEYVWCKVGVTLRNKVLIELEFSF